MIRRHQSTIIIGSLLIAAGSSTTANAQTAWSQFQGNAAHSGFVAEDTSYSTLQQGWSSPILASGKEFVINQQGVIQRSTMVRKQ